MPIALSLQKTTKAHAFSTRGIYFWRVFNRYQKCFLERKRSSGTIALNTSELFCLKFHWKSVTRALRVTRKEIFSKIINILGNMIEWFLKMPLVVRGSNRGRDELRVVLRPVSSKIVSKKKKVLGDSLDRKKRAALSCWVKKGTWIAYFFFVYGLIETKSFLISIMIAFFILNSVQFFLFISHGNKRQNKRNKYKVTFKITQILLRTYHLAKV